MTTAFTPLKTVHATLSTTTADSITWRNTTPVQSFTVVNKHATELLYFRCTPTTEVQTITFTSFDATDTIKFTHNSVESVAVTYSADVSAAIQAALEALPSIGVGNVLVTQTSVAIYVCTFREVLKWADVGAITCTSGTGSATGSVAETVKGGSAVAVAAAEGTYVVLPMQSKVVAMGATPSVISIVGNGNTYSVEVL